MRRALPLVALAIGAVWTVGVSAQGKNFAGSWTIDQERTQAANAALAAAAGGGGGGEMRSAAGGRGGGGTGGAVAATGATGGARSGGGGGVGEVAVMRGAGGGGGGRGGPAGPTQITMDASTFTFGTTAYKLDGSTTTLPGPNGDRIAKAAWKGDHLVIETTNPTQNGPVVTTTTYYLEGAALVRETTSPAPDGSTRTLKTYFKKAS